MNPFHTPSRAILPPAAHRLPRSAGGFTLIELVAVMGIVLALSLVAVGSYVGIVRAIAARAGINHVHNAVMLARQHACMDGRRTYLYVLSETEYVICRRVGRVTTGRQEGSPGGFRDVHYFEDRYTDLASYTNELAKIREDGGKGLRLFDLSVDDPRPYAAVWGIVYTNDSWSVVVVPWSSTSASFTRTTDRIFEKPNDYGVELYSVRELPRGYVFKPRSGTTFTPYYLFFEPNGSSGPESTEKVEILETIKPDPVQYVQVDNGRITDGPPEED